MNALQAPSLYQAYLDELSIGAAITGRMLDDENKRGLILRHFNSLTAENEMKPERILDRNATVLIGDPVRAALRFDVVDKLLSFASQNGKKVRFHTLNWHNQTPRWFFVENWSDAPDAPLAPKDVILSRQETYIRDVMTHVNAAFAQTVYAWDVVNEAIEPEQGAPGMYRAKSLWYQTLGEGFIASAFRAARKYQAPGQKLYYNDYNSFFPNKRGAIAAMLRKLKEDELVDGMGMQAHLQLDRINIPLCEAAARTYGDLGLGLQVTEMDIHCNTDREDTQLALAKAYGDYFDMLLRLRREGYHVESATLWGVTDADSWLHFFRREQSFPLLFTGDLQTKPAFDAVLKAPEKYR